jgi:hypothetical protein
MHLFVPFVVVLARCIHAQEHHSEDCSSEVAPARLNASSLLQKQRVSRRPCDPPSADELHLPLKRHMAARTARSALHDVVGKDGVLMISLKRLPARAKYTSLQLHRVGIAPRIFPATDSDCSSPEALGLACIANQSSCEADPDKVGSGCNSVEAAIADSHRRALELAQRRESNWTAIIEDDIIPVVLNGTANWNEQFTRIWSEIPAGVLMVRLSWCFPPGWEQGSDQIRQAHAASGTFQLAYSGWPAFGSEGWIGGCTSSYVIHKKLVPELLKVFPCCGPLDACIEWDFFKRTNPDSPDGRPRSKSIMIDMDMAGSVEYIRGRSTPDKDLHQHGVFMQDRNELPSSVGHLQTASASRHE